MEQAALSLLISVPIPSGGPTHPAGPTQTQLPPRGPTSNQRLCSLQWFSGFSLGSPWEGVKKCRVQASTRRFSRPDVCRQEVRVCVCECASVQVLACVPMGHPQLLVFTTAVSKGCWHGEVRGARLASQDSGCGLSVYPGHTCSPQARLPSLLGDHPLQPRLASCRCSSLAWTGTKFTVWRWRNDTENY